MIKIANRLEVPDKTKAILWDLDGTLIDSLSLDYKICNKLIKEFVSQKASVSRDFIRSLFAYHVPVFWKKILKKVETEFDISDAINKYDKILSNYNSARQSEKFPLNIGVAEIVEEISKSNQLTQAIVSNNPTRDIEEILENSNIAKYFKVIIGNDIEVKGKKLAKKPSPDTFLYAADQLGISIENCVVVEDSIIGVTGGKASGAYVVGVATGSADFNKLKNAGANRIYNSLKL